MASIRDVAKKANVAACTVSRVMNGTANVAPETRQKIEDAMKELNYIPNELARGMFRQKSGTVAMLIPSIRHPYFSNLAHCIESKLYEKGYKLMLCSTDGQIEREREYINILKTNIVDGVIMGVSDLEDNEYQQFDKPMIMLDYDAGKKLPIVVSDHEKGGRLAAEKFMESQCRYVIHIGDRELSKVESYKCHTALAHALNAAGIENRFIEIKWNEFDFSGYLEIAKTILEKYPQVDGVMAADIQAAAFLKAALKLGKKIPDDFALVSYDGTYVADVNLVNVTSIIQSADKIGDKTVEILLKLMAGQKLTKRKYLIDVVRKDGETTK
ncbi:MULTISPECIES: LacI family DNA-binding transcriptional regulator [Blautia]|uniref:LacI family DNA-binding transcriptional regulator n=1 Tax=Blautia hominis TaxID=2025493 RepID=A0ABQ0BDS4_9FIRM|nr:LacI family DNA-binding transcriptional regulator [Blautia marasmi]